MTSGPCLRRCRVVRRYMPMRLQYHRLYVKPFSSIRVSMYFEPFREGNAVNTGVPCPKVPIHRKLGYVNAAFLLALALVPSQNRVPVKINGLIQAAIFSAVAAAAPFIIYAYQRYFRTSDSL